MLYSTLSTTAFLILFSLRDALAAPLDTRIGDFGSQDNKKIIQDTMPTVNQRIKNMQAVANLPEDEAKNHPAVIQAFGNDANIPEIKKTVDTLETAKITIPHTNPADGITQGGTNEANGQVLFGSTFYSSDTDTRAGTIIHEATHSKAKTVDAFDKDGKPYEKMADIPKDKVAAGVQIGYKDSNLDQLKEKHSDQMHRNADSYRVFSEACPNVRRSLYRRAMAETRPVIRSELLRRAATSCAWKPKSTPKAKTDSNSKASSSEQPITVKKSTDVTGNRALPGSQVNKNSDSKATKQHTSNGPAANKGVNIEANSVNKQAARTSGNKLRTTTKSNVRPNSQRVNKAGNVSKGLKSSGKGISNGPSSKTRVSKTGGSPGRKLSKAGSSATKLRPRPNSASVMKGAKPNSASQQVAKSRSASRKPTSQALKSNLSSRKSVKSNGAAKKTPKASSPRTLGKKSTKSGLTKKATKSNSAAKKTSRTLNSASKKASKSKASSKKIARPQGSKKMSVKPTSRRPTSARPAAKKSVSKVASRTPSSRGKSGSRAKPVSKKSSSKGANKKPANRPATQKGSKRPVAQKPASKSRSQTPKKSAAQKPVAKSSSRSPSKPAAKSTKGRK